MNWTVNGAGPDTTSAVKLATGDACSGMITDVTCIAGVTFISGETLTCAFTGIVPRKQKITIAATIKIPEISVLRWDPPAEWHDMYVSGNLG
ncbi:MAG: hypothetical protein HGA55_07440 [Methanoregulaceae archaeon]|nr:hypothetical protein [Methanoregulaceae archaeon]